MKSPFDIVPLWVKWVTSGFCALLLGTHVFYPKITLDWVSIALLGLVLVPWYIHLIKSVELPGGAKLGLGIEQSTTDSPVPPSQETSDPGPALLSDPQVMKTLKTLWKYQQEYYSNDPVKRWTFVVNPQTPGYGDYLASIASLVKAGYVSISPDRGFCMLTNEGISFCKANTEQIMNSTSIYHF